MKLSKYRLSFLGVSSLVILIGFIFIILGGLKPGIDFTGGATLTLKIPNVDSSSVVRNSLANTQYDNSIIQNFGDNTFFIRTVMIDDDQKKNILQNLDTITPDKDVEILSFDLISPLIANETVVNAIWAVLAATIGIFIYIWFAFRNVPHPLRYSVAAIIALLHDTLIVVGIFALLGFLLNYEINTMFIIAFLTVLGYSVNDSIVVLDRLRSNILDFGGMRLNQMVDLSVSQTFGRSLNTSITLLVTLLAMYIFGGDTLKPFILVLIVGVISGTYSSIAIATQILVIWDERN